MDLTSPVTRKVLRLWICSTEVQCQRVPVWSHIQKGKRFNSSLMGMLFMRSSLPVERVIESGMPAGAEWQPWGPGDQCFDNKCLLLFGLGAWCLLCCSYCPLGLHDCVPCQKGTWTKTHTGPLCQLSSPVEVSNKTATNTTSYKVHFISKQHHPVENILTHPCIVSPFVAWTD